MERLSSDALILRSVVKQYGGLRPLRVSDLRIHPRATTMLIGFDRPAAEIFVNLMTGAALPDEGEVISLGRPTREIKDSDEWLSFVEQFGIVSDRVVMLEALTVAQNLAMSFDLDLDPIPTHVVPQIDRLASEVGIDAGLLESRMADAGPLLRSRVHLARALALDPAMLVLEHPTAHLSRSEGAEYASVVKNVQERRRLTVVGLLLDQNFAKAAGGRLLFWQPATGELRPPSRFALWRGNPTSER